MPARPTADIAKRRKIDPATCYNGVGTKGVVVVGDQYRIKGHLYAAPAE